MSDIAIPRDPDPKRAIEALEWAVERAEKGTSLVAPGASPADF